MELLLLGRSNTVLLLPEGHATLLAILLAILLATVAQIAV